MIELSELSEGRAVRLAYDPDIGYEEERLLLKLDRFSAGIIVTQSTIGISLFTLHQPMSQVGLGFSLLVSIFTCYITIYGATRLDWIASRIEEKHPENECRIKNAYELFNLMPGGQMEKIKWLTVISNLSLMAASSISNLCLLGTMLSIRPMFRPVLRSAILRHQDRHFRVHVSHLLLHHRTREDREIHIFHHRHHAHHQ